MARYSPKNFRSSGKFRPEHGYAWPKIKTVGENTVGRIIEVIDDGKLSYVVHLWDRPDHTKFTVAGTFYSRIRAEDELKAAEA